MAKKTKTRPLFEPTIVLRALTDSVVRLSPLYHIRKPVMFVVEAGAALTTTLFVYSILVPAKESPSFVFAVSLCLWLTVLFANLAESMAEGRGKAQADSLRGSRKDVMAKRLSVVDPHSEVISVPSSENPFRRGKKTPPIPFYEDRRDFLVPLIFMPLCEPSVHGSSSENNPPRPPLTTRGGFLVVISPPLFKGGLRGLIFIPLCARRGMTVHPKINPIPTLPLPLKGREST